MAISQRLKQGIRALLAFTRGVDYDFAAQYLTEEQMVLFKKMSHTEQLHSVNVLRHVLKHNDSVPHDLALGALMHDVGKSRYHLAVWQKTISVLLKRFAPKLAQDLSLEEKLTFWRAPFVVRRYHPQWSATLLAQTNASERAIWLARHHQDNADKWREHPHYELLCKLQTSDDVN